MGLRGLLVWFAALAILVGVLAQEDVDDSGAVYCPNLQLSPPTELSTELLKTLPGIFLGHHVRVFSNYALVGGYGFKKWKGAAWIFKVVRGKWKKEAMLVPPKATHVVGGYFGLALDGYGGRAIVGHPFARPYGKDSGMAHVFQRSPTGWVRRAVLSAPANEGMAGAYYGYDVAMFENYLAVGARYQDNPRNGLAKAGAVYIYKADNMKYRLMQTLRGPLSDIQFGDTVHLGKNFLHVGSPRAPSDDGILEEGRSFIYKLRGDQKWFLLDEITPGADEDPSIPDANRGSHFGEGIHWYEGSFIVGGETAASPLGGMTGAAYIYTMMDGKIEKTGELFPTSPSKSNFAQRLARHGKLVIVSAWADKSKGVKAGAWYAYVRCTDKKWRLFDKFYRVNASGEEIASAGDEYGKGIHMDDRFIIVGCPKCDSGSRRDVTDRGAADVYKYSFGEPIRVA